MIPQHLKLTKTHEWAAIDEETGLVIVGISDFAIQQLGDIVFIELPSVGQTTTQNAPFGVIESVKAAVDLCAPVAGKVVEVNKRIVDDFDILSEDPYGGGWIIKIGAAEPKQLDDLMTSTDYEEFIQGIDRRHQGRDQPD